MSLHSDDSALTPDLVQADIAATPKRWATPCVIVGTLDEAENDPLVGGDGSASAS